MMNSIKRILMGAALLLPIITFAGEYPWLTFSMADGTEMSVAADNLAINYDGGSLVLKSATVDQTIPVAQVESMQFTQQAAGLAGIMAGDQHGDVVYYTVSGVNAGAFASVDDARASLPSGVYVVKGSVKTVKVIF